MSCSNEKSEEWLQQTVSGLSPWEGAVFSVGRTVDMLKTARVLVWVPSGIVGTENTKEILGLLGTQ